MTQPQHPDAAAGLSAVRPSGRTHVTIRRCAYLVEKVMDLDALHAAGRHSTADFLAARGWDAVGEVRVRNGIRYAFRLDRLQQWMLVGVKGSVPVEVRNPMAPVAQPARDPQVSALIAHVVGDAVQNGDRVALGACLGLEVR